VADEHLATAAAQVAIASLYPLFPWPRLRSPRVLVAGVEGNRHELGLRMAADLLALDGWDDLFLGADIPVAALVEKAVEVRPALIALGITLPAHLATLEHTIAALRARLGSPRILVGGRLCGPMRDQILALGVAAADSIAQGVELAREWR
jgi:MerR family transcriptional regulator, light-induced transcriptional regulator